MYTEEQFIKLEQEEHELTEEAIAAILLVLVTTKGNLEKELRDFYSKYGTDGVVTWQEARKWISDKDHTRRMNALMLYLSGELASALLSIKPKFEQLLKSVIGKEMGFFDVEIDWKAILDMPWGADNATWLKRLEADVKLWDVRIATDWKRSILQRKNLKEVLKLLDKRFTSIEAIVTKLGLTESTAIGSLARQKIFKNLGVNEYQFYTRADERTCEICGSMHGLIFPMTAYEVGTTASPLHPHCRCWEVPIWD